jgi:hypothetical protein
MFCVDIFLRIGDCEGGCLRWSSFNMRTSLGLCAGVALPEQCRVEHGMIQKQIMSVHQLLLSTAASDAADPTICLCAVSYSCRIQRNKGTIGPVCKPVEVFAHVLRGKGLEDRYQHFGTTYQSLLHTSSFLDCMPFVAGAGLLSQNVGNELLTCAVQYSRSGDLNYMTACSRTCNTVIC